MAVSAFAERDDFVSVGPYSIQAHGLSLRSRGSATDLDGADVNIMAEGAGPLNSGSVNIFANTQVAIHAGGNQFGLAHSPTSNAVIVHGSDPGKMTLVQGDTPLSPKLELSGAPAMSAKLSAGPAELGASIELKPEGMTLRFGPSGVGSAVQLNAQGVKLSFGLCSMKLEAAGIELSMGPNKIALSPKGVEINGLMLDLNATTRAALQGLQVQVQGLALLKAGAPITMVG